MHDAHVYTGEERVLNAEEHVHKEEERVLFAAPFELVVFVRE